MWIKENDNVDVSCDWFFDDNEENVETLIVYNSKFFDFDDKLCSKRVDSKPNNQFPFLSKMTFMAVSQEATIQALLQKKKKLSINYLDSKKFKGPLEATTELEKDKKDKNVQSNNLLSFLSLKKSKIGSDKKNEKQMKEIVISIINEKDLNAQFVAIKHFTFDLEIVHCDKNLLHKKWNEYKYESDKEEKLSENKSGQANDNPPSTSGYSSSVSGEFREIEPPGSVCTYGYLQ